MSDFEALKAHLSLILRELDQVQHSINKLQDSDTKSQDRINDIRRDVDAVSDKVEVLKQALGDNKKLLYYIIGVFGFGYGFAQFLGIEKIWKVFRGE